MIGFKKTIMLGRRLVYCSPAPRWRKPNHQAIRARLQGNSAPALAGLALPLANPA